MNTAVVVFMLEIIFGLIAAFAIVLMEQRTTARWRLLMTRMYAVPTVLDHAAFDLQFVQYVCQEIEWRTKLDQAKLIAAIVEAVRVTTAPPAGAAAQFAAMIEAAVDTSIGSRLPTAEQFEASVKAIVTAREAVAKNNGGHGVGAEAGRS